MRSVLGIFDDEQTWRTVVLSDKQQKTMQAIRSYFKQTGLMPSVRTLSQGLGVSSRAVQQQIDLLKKKGYLLHQEPITSSYVLPESHTSSGIPYLGAIAAGRAAPAFENSEQFIDINPSFFSGSQQTIALSVVGDSMLGDHISDGDIAIIESTEAWKEDDILALRIDGDDCTLKRIKKNGSVIQLRPSNPVYKTYEVAEHRVQVIGRFVGLIRKH